MATFIKIMRPCILHIGMVSLEINPLAPTKYLTAINSSHCQGVKRMGTTGSVPPG